MKLFGTIKRLLWRRAFWAALFFAMLAINGIAVLAYTSNNRNELIYNPLVKSGLPLYRAGRELANSIIDSAYVFAMRRDAGIPQYRLEVKTSDLRKLNDALPSSLSDGVIAGDVFFTEAMEDTVKGALYHNGKKYDVKVRYRGQNANHWTRPKKSWQIKFDKDTPFEGIRTLKLILPDDRGYFAEALNNYRAKKLGAFVPDAEFVQLYVNNDYHGVYFGIEDFTSEFLEKNQKPADANIYATGDQLGVSGEELTVFDSIEYWRKESDDKLFGYENFAELDFLFNLMQRDNPESGSGTSFGAVVGDIIDLESFYAWNTVAILAGSNHQSNWGNMRLYFNNTKGKFEFLPWDVSIKNYLPAQLANDITKKILNNPDLHRARNQVLWDYVSKGDNLNDDLRYYDDLYEKLKGAFYSDFKKHDNNSTFNRTVADIRSQYQMLFERVRGLFEEDSVALTMRHDASARAITLSFDIESFSGLNLDSIEFPGSSQLASGVDRYLFRPNEEVIVHYTGGAIDDISEIQLKLSNTVTGESVKIKSVTYVDSSTFAHFSDIGATVDEFVQKHSQFRKQGNDIALFAGVHVFNDDVVAPKGAVVRIYPGAAIYFAPGASFVSYSPVEARGTAVQPILLRRINPDEPWGSFAVLNSGADKSTLEYLDADGGSSDYINGAFLSGMVSVYYSDVDIRNATITRSASDDGINIKYANATVANSTFRDNSADGLDADYVSGVIHDSDFIYNGNDGIDLSGSKITIRNNRITGSGDKCVSIGEQTAGTIITNTTMDSCNIGIEVKDNSKVSVVDSVITNNAIGISAYMKKPIYQSGGRVDIYTTTVENNQTKVQADEFSEIVGHGSEAFNPERP